MNLRDLVRSYVEESLANADRDGMAFIDGDLPEEMRASDGRARGGWFSWKKVPSTTTDEDLDDLEQQFGFRFPEPYRVFLKTAHFCELGNGNVEFYPHILKRWSTDLTLRYRSEDGALLLEQGFVPFAKEAFADAGPICFDVRKIGKREDCPVVLCEDDGDGNLSIQPLFSSSMHMFQCLHILAQHRLNVFLHDEDEEDDRTLDQKRSTLRAFLAADPDGAGDGAYDYWTGWDVHPDD